ncbi:hypothetical protein C8Q76DRAFT_277999 [Earliella scabrosa]|nr:hypothetical protein C8Q76DRAFT_277999 [Earliella scabrosa]
MPLGVRVGCNHFIRKIQIYVSNPGVYRDRSPARRLCATLLQPHSPSLPHSVCSVHSVWLLPMPPRRKVYEEESEDAASGSLPIALLMLHKTLTTRVPECHVEPQSEPIEDDELEMDVDEDADGDADGDGEGEDGDDVDIVGDGTHDDEGIVDDKDVVEEDIEDELIDDGSEADGLSSPAPAPAGPSHPRLKIKLKLPQAHDTPPRARRQAAARVREVASDIESEDEDEDEDDGGDSTRSGSVAAGGASGRALTARQAVLANVVDSSHVSLAEPPNPRKKKPLTEIEIALKREETARKRRNLTEKKLEDEKAETINRLLKKQSRARGKRNALSTAEDKPGPGENPPGEGEEEDITEAPAPPPTMYRWVSSARAQPKVDGEGDAPAERVMSLSFSVPVSVLPQKPAGDESTMNVDGAAAMPPPPRLPPSKPPTCDVQGCNSFRKYRLVRDFQRGACGMNHLKLLEGQLA